MQFCMWGFIGRHRRGVDSEMRADVELEPAQPILLRFPAVRIRAQECVALFPLLLGKPGAERVKAVRD